MATWTEVERAAPELVAAARVCFDLGEHKTMATLRRDGSPRISGTEIEFRVGELWIGSMPGAVKARDLQRDGRVAIHSPSVDPGDDPSSWPGEAKLSGVAHEVTDPDVIARWAGEGPPPPPGGMHLFRIDVTELVVTGLTPDGQRLRVDWWQEQHGVRHIERE